MPRRCPDVSSPPGPGQGPSVLRPREDGCWLRMAARPAQVIRRAASALSGPSAGRGSWRSPCSGPLVWTCSSEMSAFSECVSRRTIHGSGTGSEESHGMSRNQTFGSSRGARSVGQAHEPIGPFHRPHGRVREQCPCVAFVQHCVRPGVRPRFPLSRRTAHSAGIRGRYRATHPSLSQHIRTVEQCSAAQGP